ncbi:MAG: hypothetical protein V2B14_06960 [bacterium]
MYQVSQQQIPGRTGAGAVEINIYNPTANANPVYNSAYQNPYFQQNQTLQQQNQTLQQQLQTLQNNAQQPNKQQPEEKDKSSKSKPKSNYMPLTDDYIRSLENYLNNQNADVRLEGIKEVLKRFKEDPERKNDKALTNLLNKALQDPTQAVRLIALTTLQADYADGDNLTYAILQKMQRLKSAYNQDSVTAAKILLKKAGQNLNIQNSSNNARISANQTSVGNNLNLLAK